MRDPIVIGVAAVVAVLLLPTLVWLILATIAAMDGGDGCAWIAGYGGCLPF